jgi:heparosan-N-sulfate-glucuronate 5-epimerase
MYRTTFNFIGLLLLVMRKSTKAALTVTFIITSSISLLQSGIFSSFSHYSSIFPTTTAVYAFQKKTTNTNTSSSTIPDKKGIMMYDYGGKTGKVYNPLIIAQGGQKYYQNYINDSSDKKSKEYFLNTANWFVNHAKEKENNGIHYSLWTYHFPWPFYRGLTPPYSSALAQSAGIKILILAHNLTGDEMYIDAADKAFGSFLVDYDKGGVITREGGKEDYSMDNSNNGDDSIFLQEIAKPGYLKTYILNGHIFSLIDLWNYYKYTHDGNVAIVFNKGLKYLKDNLWKYDTGKWSYYDQVGDRATNGYQKIHTEQLAKLYEITGEPILKSYSDKFARYLAVANDITALNNKGLALAKLGKYNESIVFFDKALAINPNNTAALNNKGLALAKLGKYNESIVFFDKALAINPNYVYALNNKNSSLEELKHHNFHSSTPTTSHASSSNSTGLSYELSHLFD